MRQHIYPARRLSGKIRLQGDKSISHRALMIGAIAEGTTEIANLNSGKDVQSTISCLKLIELTIKHQVNLYREILIFIKGQEKTHYISFI